MKSDISTRHCAITLYLLYIPTVRACQHMQPILKMSTSSKSRIYKVAVLIFHGADILDFTGPMEILSHASRKKQPIFEITTIAGDETITTSSSAKIKADLLLPNAYPIISTFDILIVPGAAPSLVHKLTESDTPEQTLIRAFARTNPSRPRIIFSICTGAFLLGAAGILPGITVTTHQHGLEILREVCSRSGSKEEPRIVRRRFVDGQFVRGSRVRVVTAGGISSGLDATFYIVCLLAGAEMASWIARVMEYGWREPARGLWPRGFAGPRSVNIS